MTRGFAGVVFVLTASLTALAQQTRDTAPPPQATGRISGTVVGAESQRPVRFARVEIESRVGQFATVTDDAGAFAFERLRPGAYVLKVSKIGYLETAYGQARPGTTTPGKRIELGDKEQIERLVVPLSQGGSISGVIRDDHGDPAYHTRVDVSRWVMRNGIRTLETVESTMTDERGRYRISLLPPRDYVVRAVPDEESIPEAQDRPQVGGFAPAFYPGTMSARTAGVISLALGEDRSEIDFQVPLVPLGRVTGTVLSTEGKPVTNIPVSLANKEHGDMEQGTETDGAGRFTFERVVPGEYAISAGKSSGSGHVTFMAKKFRLNGDGVSDFSIAIDRKSEVYEVTKALGTQLKFLEAEVDASGRVTKATSVGSASGEVNVTGMATSDIVLTMESLRTVAGRITTEGSSAPPVLRGTVVELTAALAGRRSSRSQGRGGRHVRHRRRAAWQVHRQFRRRSAALDARCRRCPRASMSLDYLLEVPRDRDVRDLVLTLRDRSSELSGTVTDATLKPATDRTVIRVSVR